LGEGRRVVATFPRSGKVSYAERNPLAYPTATTPNDPYFKTGAGALLGGQWEMPLVQAPAAWDMTTGNSSVVIAVVDSGIAPHPDLVGRLLTGHSVLDNSTTTSDTYGHGTYVAGVVAADSNNAQGLAGTCWNCRLLPVKVYTTSSATVSNLATGIIWAADHGAQIVNVSMATPTASSTLDNAVAYATNHGALVVAAAGNSGCNCAAYPAASPGALGVASSDQKDALDGSSNYGNWVGIDAPTGEVTTSLTDPATGAQWGYAPIGGTSLASPVVAGIAGLVLSVAPGLSPAALKTLLMQSVDPVTGTHLVASGRINAYKAVLAAGGVATKPSPSPTSTTTSSSPSASPSPTTSTTTFSGTLTSKSTSKAFALTMGSGATHGALTFGKCTAMTVALATNAGTPVASASGGNGVSVSATVAVGSYNWMASGSSRCTFTLTVTYSS
jgi:thermitase